MESFDSQQLQYFFEQLWRTSDEPFWICKPVADDFEMVMANQAALNIEPAQQPGTLLSEIAGQGPEWNELIANYHRCLNSGQTQIVAQRPRLKGKKFYFEAILVPILDNSGKVTHIWGTARNLTRFMEVQDELQTLNNQLEQKVAERTQALHQAMARLEHQSYTDSLTGLSNRRRFNQVLELEVSRLTRSNGTLSLMMLDIDDFKQFNDTYGHPTGDSCLAQIGGLLHHAIKRPTDLACRYGGEEFVIILPDTTVEGAHKLAEDIREALSTLSINHNGTAINENITMSIGLVSCALQEQSQLKDVINTADLLLYQAKSRGKDTLVFSDKIITGKSE
ncbi:sensor domain-containing diguanylate cyclase [Lacimicrobium alkaliphilum]|nr:sensor domain-containing diguanylate cyclase [Lacimicrobium alkaliphilum]